jgi:hypothetical protein
VLDLHRRGRLERLEDLAGRRIHGLNAHGGLLLFLRGGWTPIGRGAIGLRLAASPPRA